MTEDERERAGVEVGGRPLFLARASAWDKAERYEAAEAMVAREGEERFLNLEGEGDIEIAIGEGELGAMVEFQ